MRFRAILLLCLLPAVAAAGPADLTGADLAPAGVCVFGNQSATAWGPDDWVQGQESYAVMFAAERPACGCPDGFQVEAVHMSLDFGPEDVPASISVSAVFWEASLALGDDCPSPGAVIHQSARQAIDITTAGTHVITVPMELGSIPCAQFDHEYAVGLQFHSSFASRPDIMTLPTFPTSCLAYKTFTGWWDMAQFAVAPPLLHADIVCCSGAVPAEERAWGALKSLYR